MGNLENIRKKIDQIDNEIISLLKERKKQIKKIKEIKKTFKKPVKDIKREELVLKKTTEEYEKNIFIKIIEESRKLQE